MTVKQQTMVILKLNLGGICGVMATSVEHSSKDQPLHTSRSTDFLEKLIGYPLGKEPPVFYGT
jgi:hypothetical protein